MTIKCIVVYTAGPKGLEVAFFLYQKLETGILKQLKLKSSRNKKDLNDVTAATFSVFFAAGS